MRDGVKSLHLTLDSLADSRGCRDGAAGSGLRSERMRRQTGASNAIKLLDLFTGAAPDVYAVDAAWMLSERAVAHEENETTG
jgi:hypothetical protein